MVIRAHEGHHSEQEAGFRQRTRRGPGCGDPERGREHRMRFRNESRGQEEDGRGQDEALSRIRWDLRVAGGSQPRSLKTKNGGNTPVHIKMTINKLAQMDCHLVHSIHISNEHHG